MAAPSPSASVSKLAIIGGSSFLDSAKLADFALRTVDTPHGSVQLRTSPSGAVVFVQRHAANPQQGKEYSPPHLINYKAIAKALQQLVGTKKQHAIARRWLPAAAARPPLLMRPTPLPPPRAPIWTWRGMMETCCATSSAWARSRGARCSAGTGNCRPTPSQRAAATTPRVGLRHPQARRAEQRRAAK